ncbi:hypothetical protein SPFM12_00220 [Salmonella phage SPFM12]|nr:hypothetical protein SPFM12_00220 [Salmonella phage SPFM12]
MKGPKTRVVDDTFSTSTQFAAHALSEDHAAKKMFCAELFKYMPQRGDVVVASFAEAKSGPGFYETLADLYGESFDGRLRWVFSPALPTLYYDQVLNLVEKGTISSIILPVSDPISIYKSIMAQKLEELQASFFNWLYDCSSG